jgi:DNA invertase Pin-like site-specific DNA recombinase
MENLQRAALYARVSTRDKGQDTENQLAQLRQRCRDSGQIVVHEFIDYVSGKTGNREQFQAMYRSAEAREFDVLIFWSLDRFSREGTLETLKYLERLSKAGVGWQSHTEPYLDSCGVFKDAVLSILATIAKQERIRISERTKAGLAIARSKGRIGGRRAIDKPLDQITALRSTGASLAAIASQTGLSRSTIHRVLNQ